MNLKGIADYNRKAIALVPGVHRTKRDLYLSQVERVPADGVVEGVYKSRPLGHRCIWSCRWSTRQGLIEARDWFSLDSLTIDQLMAEGLDIVYRRPEKDPRLTRLVLEALDGSVADVNYWAVTIQGMLYQSRLDVAEYIWPYDPPPMNSASPYVPRLMQITVDHVRPGWGTQSDILAKAREAEPVPAGGSR